jgi:hypothetical protein
MFPLGFRFVSVVLRIAGLCVAEVKKKKAYVIPVLNSVIKDCHEGMWISGGIAPPFLTTPLDGGEWSASHPPGKSPPVPFG